mmetsp:Transcript_59416/g.173856  ORF Transcript_59416/g.173856 Transcript_59416/m.173856 type:complete len:243 (+) Transcript_59416:379-1107(+)
MGMQRCQTAQLSAGDATRPLCTQNASRPEQSQQLEHLLRCLLELDATTSSTTPASYSEARRSRPNRHLLLALASWRGVSVARVLPNLGKGGGIIAQELLMARPPAQTAPAGHADDPQREARQGEWEPQREQQRPGERQHLPGHGARHGEHNGCKEQQVLALEAGRVLRVLLEEGLQPCLGTLLQSLCSQHNLCGHPVGSHCCAGAELLQCAPRVLALCQQLGGQLGFQPAGGVCEDHLEPGQ